MIKYATIKGKNNQTTMETIPTVNVTVSQIIKKQSRKILIMKPITRETILKKKLLAQINISKPVFCGTDSTFFHGKKRDLKTIFTEKKKTQKFT
ncbi:MAG: hypothetical protein WC472_02665 [Candidatus Paceibacterota bacterium]